MVLNKNNKFLIIAYRIAPEIFAYNDLSRNSVLKKLLQNNCGQLTNNYKFVYPDTFSPTYNSNLYTYNFERSFRFSSLFYQENLGYEDYMQCDLCKKFVCPYHVYLSNFLFKHCSMCNKKKWVICGWCKFDFNEYWGCIILHQDKILPQTNKDIHNMDIDTNTLGNFI